MTDQPGAAPADDNPNDAPKQIATLSAADWPEPPAIDPALMAGNDGLGQYGDAIGQFLTDTGMLTPAHAQYLRDRGVARDVAIARGYTSVVTRAGVKALGPFSESVARTVNGPDGCHAIAIPLYHAGRNDPSLYQLRPDRPRMAKSPNPAEKAKTMKFEIPGGVRRGSEHGDLPADVHPMCHHEATDEDTPLLLTEGVVKADAALTAARREGLGIVPVALTGVTLGFSSTRNVDDDGNEITHRELTEALTSIPFVGRVVYLCWDSDWHSKRQVRSSLFRTGDLLAAAGAQVHYVNLPAAGTDKCGLDDYLVQHSDDPAPLATLLSQHLMDNGDLVSPEQEEADEERDTAELDLFEIDPERLRIYGYTTRQRGASDTKTRRLDVKLDALPEIASAVSVARITDLQLEETEDQFIVVVRWRDDAGLVRSREVIVPTTDFDNVRAWMALHAATKMRHFSPTPADERKIAETILHAARHAPHEMRAVSTGWYRSEIPAPGSPTTTPTGSPRDTRWRYVTGRGWFGPDFTFGDDVTCESDSQAKEVIVPPPGTDLELLRSATPYDGEDGLIALSAALSSDERQQSAAAAFRDWWSAWVMDGPNSIGEQTYGEMKATGVDPTRERRQFDLSKILRLGAVAIARAITPGAPNKGLLLLLGLPGSGKTLTARCWTSAFGNEFGHRPYLDLRSTSAGIEVQLADANNALVVVDDFRIGDTKETERMNAVVDGLARSAHDGSRRQRSTRDLRTMAAPVVNASVILTGETMPTVSEATNSTAQRMIIVSFPHPSTIDPRVTRRLATLAEETPEPQQLALSAMLSWVANCLADIGPGEIRQQVREFRNTRLKVDVDMFRDSIVAQAAELTRAPISARTKVIVEDFAVGGATLLGCAESFGVPPDELDRATALLTEMFAWVTAQTANSIASTSPAAKLVDSITAALDSGEAYLSLVDGQPPRDHEVALHWGWKPEDGKLKHGSRQIGWVLQTDVGGEPTAVIALQPEALKDVFRRSGQGLGQLSPKQIAEQLNTLKMTVSELDPDTGRTVARETTALAVKPESTTPTVRLRVGEAPKSVVAMIPVAMGIPIPDQFEPAPSSAGAGEEF